jgi:23S rRNA (cytidine2498-2'-O)-methyltransferase
MLRAYLAPDGFIDDLAEEIGGADKIYDRLLLKENGPEHAVWAENIWLDPQYITIDSIGDAARKLKAIQRNWWPYEFHMHRRMSLVTEKLPHISGKPLVFPNPLPVAPLGSWTMIDEKSILASPHCASAMPNGRFEFVENKETPPNRAYLKLWEALTRIGKMPKAGETCLDLGACPGGWTWVLQTLGANVISVDKAPLDPKIAALPNIRYVQQSAFGLKPEDIGPVDWLFSDIICYPERLLRLVDNWKKSSLAKNMVCTIKFQGETDMAAVAKFLEVSGSFALHLYNNKHEITWVSLE